MADDKKSGLHRTIQTLFIILPSMINIACYFKFILKREAEKLTKNIIVILILSVLSAILLAGVWISLLGIVYLCLLTKFSMMMSLFFLLILNLIVLLLVSMYIIRVKNQLFDFFKK